MNPTKDPSTTTPEATDAYEAGIAAEETLSEAITRLDSQIAELNERHRAFKPNGPFTGPALPPLARPNANPARFIEFKRVGLAIDEAHIARASLLLADAEARLSDATAQHGERLAEAERDVSDAITVRKDAEAALAEAVRDERMAKERLHDIVSGDRQLRREVDDLRFEVDRWQREADKDRRLLAAGEQRAALRAAALAHPLG